MVVVKGRVEARGEGREIFVENIVPLKEARKKLAKGIVVDISTVGLEDAMIEKLHGLCEDYKGNRELAFKLHTPTHGHLYLRLKTKLI